MIDLVVGVGVVVLCCAAVAVWLLDPRWPFDRSDVLHVAGGVLCCVAALWMLGPRWWQFDRSEKLPPFPAPSSLGPPPAAPLLLSPVVTECSPKFSDDERLRLREGCAKQGGYPATTPYLVWCWASESRAWRDPNALLWSANASDHYVPVALP